MELKKGYKQTEVGVIPNDWEMDRLENVVDFSNGKGHEQFIVDDSDFLVVNSKFVSTEGKVVKYSSVNLSPLKTGDIAIVMSDIPNGKALAKCYLVEKDNAYTLNQRIGCLHPKEGDSKYFYYQLNRHKYFLSFDSGTGQTNLKRAEILDCPIPFPPTKSEQTAIATALSDADALITSLEKLIAKKRNIKQGAMQQLLKPKKGWVVKRLGDVASVVGGGTPRTNVPEYWNGNIDWFTPTEIGERKYVFSSERKITAEGFKNCSGQILPIGTILLTSRAGIGDLGILMTEGCTNQGFQSLIPNKNVHNEFLYYLMSTQKNALLQNASGSTFLEISPSKVKAIEVSIPSHTEQVEIASILSDMDKEVMKLESKLEKCKSIKQGMMQNLLTGKIRLV